MSYICESDTGSTNKQSGVKEMVKSLQQGQPPRTKADHGPPQWPTFLEVLSLGAELIWVLIQATFATLYSIFLVFVPPKPKDVTGEIVLITGAGHGMGREVAVRFAKLGAIVVSVDINPKGNEETVRIVQDAGGKAFSYLCDVTDKSSVTQLAEKVRQDVGEVTILVNNAGIMPCKPLLKHTEKDIRAVVDINVVGYLWMIQAFLPSMLKRNHGHIASMSSMVALGGGRNLVPYSATKYAVKGIMEALALEFDDYAQDTSGLKLTTIYPYIIDTGLAKKPKIRFQNAMKVVNPGDAADQIVDAIRRNYLEITIPSDLYYQAKFLRILPMNALKYIHEFAGASLDSHE